MKLLHLDGSMEDIKEISMIRKKRNCARDLAQILVSDGTLASVS